MTWMKSSFSNGTGGNNCVEVMQATNGDVAVRNSRHPGQAPLVFTAQEWSAFLAGVKAGEFEVRGG